jgi:ABC-type phosphate/phosphonate transport system substrate-binding protein
VAFNSTDSQSGFNSLRALIAPLAEKGQFFGDKCQTGGHRYSLAAVQQGRADIAAIDCVTLELLRRYHPQEVAGLSVIGETAAAPGLPLITSSTTSAERLSLLRQAIAETLAAPENQALCERLLITGFSVLPREEYQVIEQMKQAALQHGVSQL